VQAHTRPALAGWLLAPTALALVTALVCVALPARHGRAQGEDHPQTRRDPNAPLGPLCSDVSPDGFTLNVGTRDQKPHAARLLVYDAQARPRPTDPPLAQVDSPAATWHLLPVRGLSPARRYRYKLELDGHPDSYAEVSTAPPAGARAPLLIAAFGDERGALTGVSSTARVLIRSVLAEGPDLVLGTGDLVTRGGRWSDWTSLLDNHAPMFAQLPYFPALGNHELIDESDARTFKALFPRAARGYYTVRYGQALIVVLNSNRPSDPEQTRFLDHELQAAAADPTVRARLVLLHHAPLSASWHCGSAPYLTDWITLFERYHVDAVLAGHDHCYQRLERNGIAYFVSGGGGAPLYEQGRCDPHDELALQRYAAVHNYMMVRITPTADPRHDAIAVTARVPGGALIDSATLPLPRTQAAELRAEHLAPGVAPPSSLRLRRLWFFAKRYPQALLLLGALLTLGVLRWRRRRATRSAR
jgi:hypothetical protein